MNSTLRFVNSLQSRHHGFQPPTDHRFALQLPAIAVQLSELNALVATLPVAIAKVGADQYALVAVTGFADGRNQLVDDKGRWGSLYLPLDVRCYPFGLQPMPSQAEGQTAYGVCFNHASGLYREAPDTDVGQQRFFTDEGQPQPWFKQTTELLQHNMAQQRLTERAVKALQQANLLTPWQIQPREGHPDEVLPKGLYRIDEAKLNALKGEALETVHQAHALALAYGQLLSMSRVTVLQRLKDVHAARQKSATAAGLSSAASAPDHSIVQKVFDQGQGDTIKFNF